MSDVDLDLTDDISKVLRIDFLPKPLYRLERLRDCFGDLILQVALLHLKELSRLLPRLDLLQVTDISERNEFTVLFIEVDFSPADKES